MNYTAAGAKFESTYMLGLCLTIYWIKLVATMALSDKRLCLVRSSTSFLRSTLNLSIVYLRGNSTYFGVTTSPIVSVSWIFWDSFPEEPG